MKRNEALHVLKDALRFYEAIPSSDFSAIDITDATMLIYYATHKNPDPEVPWREDAFPLYQALMYAGPSLYRVVNSRYKKHSILDKIRILLQVSIQILRTGDITWPTHP